MLLLLLAACVACSAISPSFFSVLYDGKTYHVEPGAHILDAVAIAEWADTRDEDGWTRLKINVLKSSKLPATQKRYAAGFLEGFINQHLIFASYFNYANGTGSPFSEKMLDFANQQDEWMRNQVEANGNDVYWQKLGLVLQQWDGIVAGYMAAAPQNESLTKSQMLQYALQYEIGDIARACKEPKTHKAFLTPRGRAALLDQHCSVLIKPSSDGSKLLAAHDTWSSFNTMLRTYKTYNFLPDYSVQMSSFPGLPFSGDDWFMTSDKLVITETTNGIYNESSFASMTNETVPYWIRVQIANTETNGRDWHTTFSSYNNGGYNNQWMVVDYKLFTPGSPIVPETLVVGEQAPGLYVFEDQSAFLAKNGYWASYNVPFYKQIWTYAGYEPLYQKFGNKYSWSMCARAQIYRRDQGKVQDLDSLKTIQRYNEWQHDPLSLKDACRGIAARCDLNSPWQNNTLNGFNAFGAIDCKVTDESMVPFMITEAIAGPTYDSQPIFHWSNMFKDVPCMECPKVYDFEFVTMK